MRVAFTSNDGKTVNEHFGQATHFHVWEIGPETAEFVEIVGAFGGAGKVTGHPTGHVEGLGAGVTAAAPEEAVSPVRRGEVADRAIDAEEDRISARADAVEGCALVYTEAIGGPAAAKLVARRIHPMKSGGEAVPIAELVERLQQVLRGRPPPWLRKALGLAPAPVVQGEIEDI
jgi:nitrogen fixation protein NifX